MKAFAWKNPWHGLVAVLVAAAICSAGLLAPTEETMGHAQRIVYLHVAVAWLGLAGLVATGVTGGLYLVRRDLRWDHWAQAAAEVGWLCATLTLLTGSCWARAAWNTWWTWDPRLTTSFVLWAGYSAYLLTRAGLDDPHRRARLGAVVAIVAMLDVPLVIAATRWFRGIHPVSPQMTPGMRATLLLSVTAFTAAFCLLLALRRRQLRLEELVAEAQRQLDP